MGRRERAILGGLLTGAGDHLQQSAADRRAEAEAARERAHQIARDKLRIDATASEGEKNRDFQRGLLSKVDYDQNNQAIGLTRGGDQLDLGYSASPDRINRSRGGSGSAQDGLSAGDKRILDAAAAIYTTKGLEGEKTDWTRTAEHLRNQGYNDIADLVDPANSTPSTEIDTNSSQYLEAQRMADEWIDEQTTVFGRDSTELKDFKGNRAQARQAKTLEFYEQLAGGSAPTGSSAPSAPSAPSVPDGTRENPHKPTTQAEYDALPMGAIFVHPETGVLHRKQ